MSSRLCQIFVLAGLCLALASGRAAGQEIDLSRPAEAEPGLEELVREWRAERQSRPSSDASLALGGSLHALGVVKRKLGKTDEALDALTEACQILESAPPAQRANAQEALALTLQDAGRLPEAETLLRQLVSQRRTAGEPGELAHSLDHLAMNRLVSGDYEAVLPLIEEALQVTPEDSVADRAQMLGHLSRYYHTLGSHARSVETIDQALQIDFHDHELRLSLRSQRALSLLRLGNVEDAIDEFHNISADALEYFADRPALSVPYINNLGNLALELGNPKEAAEAFRYAIEILETEVGADHPGLITPLNNLGVALTRDGELTEARSALERCLELQNRHLDPVHLRVAETRRNLAFVYLHLDDPRALEMVDGTTKIGLQLLEKLVHNGTERERLNFLARFDPVSLPCATGDPQRIATTLIASKGRLLDALLGDTSTKLPTTAVVSSTLPPDGAFVDVCRYLPDEPLVSPRFGCVLYLPGRDPEWIPLGTEESALRWLSALRGRLQWQGDHLAGLDTPPPTLKLRTILRELEREFWAPLAAHLPPDVHHIAWSPDGALHFLPLAALLDADGTPLCHRYLQITTVGNARDLLKPRTRQSLSASPWEVVTVSHFPKPAGAEEAESPLLRTLGSLDDMPGTDKESRMLRKLAPRGSKFLQNEEATEPSLRQLTPSPAVLHLGCHAFYLADSVQNSGITLDFDDHADLLFAGGLVLYRGAMRSPSDPPVSPEDDLLFPAEIARLPLSQTRLVTLSSCDSGNGTPVSGEGLLGLRRSFHLAGAREVAVALWPVSDRSTPDFMHDFYQRALESGRPAQSLWETQRDQIPNASDPGFDLAILRFAPFILSQSGPLLSGPSIPLPPPRPLWPMILGSLFVPLITGFWLVRRSNINKTKQVCTRKAPTPGAMQPMSHSHPQ
ncbi:CHAT domain-containing protein/tetratricopeptide (TPR) repeat protein [Haloferula luteola]|uniref:CHAT domain-containing protein/tetratricopeptide (TPR) repeat protein n=1 Tax=Haloferula luteola TaxID=595692 RepID=A0A840V0Y7_9BACT|nr:CHAT domain-containing protein [Haloferula luteola]MBB5351023.1 CHAT domain-containing protein/tetratricopeptide (TPR) repeat protein [Haloferula luteola]